MSKLSDQAGIRNGWIIRILPIAAGAYALLGGSVSLLGWIIGVDRLTDWGGDGISIKANTSICLIVAGIGLLAWSLGPPVGRLVVRTAGVLTAVIGALTLSEHLLGVDYGIDTLLFWEAEGASATASLGRASTSCAAPPARTARAA